MITNSPTHYSSIDSLRGLAAVMVCLFHFVCTTTHYVTNTSVLYTFSFGEYGVHIFFVISGIVIPLSMLNNNYAPRNFGRYLLKRMVRIEPPYLLSIVVYIIYTLVRGKLYVTAVPIAIPSLQAVALHIGYLVPFVSNAQWFINTYWSLAVEFQYYVVLCALFPLLINTNNMYRIVTSALFLSSALWYNNAAFLPHWAPLFMVGITYVSYTHNKITTYEYVAWQLILIALITYLFSCTIVFVCAITLAIIHFFMDFKTKLSLFLGKISYSLYLLHGITGGIVINYLSHNYISPLQQLLVISGGFLIAITAAYLFYWGIEKPAQQLSKNIKL